jgi:hypothetical protein
MPNDASQYVSSHTLLPLDAQAMLRRAAATKVTDTDPMARIRAVDRAIKHVKLAHAARFTDAALHNYSAEEYAIPSL